MHASSADRRTVTFTLETPIKINRKQNEKFRVTADVVDGAGKTSHFVIDQEVYVQGKGLQFGYGLAINLPTWGTSTQFNILAGEITLVENQLPARKIRENQKDVVLADFGLMVNNGKDLTLEDIAFNLSGLSAPFSG